MANKKSNKKQPKKDDTWKFGVALTALAISTAGLGVGTLYGITHMKTAEEQKYLDLYPYLMRWTAEECSAIRGGDYQYWITDENGNRKLIAGDSKNVNCWFDSYGISKDGDPYVSYKYQYTDDSGVPTGEMKTSTLYYQYDAERDTYARAYAYED